MIPREATENRAQDIQNRIEQIMKNYCDEERWESIYLFSSDGFLIASYRSGSSYTEETLLEFAFTLINGAMLLGKELPVKEILLRDSNKKQLIFHYITAFDEEFIIAAVSHGKKGFRRAIARLEKQLNTIYD
ncbi:hypothetical protein J7K93_12800 [bacterium]|nr:hypothetical protein [bacterium]